MPEPAREQVVLGHEPHDPFVIHRHASPSQFGCNSAVPVAPTMFDGNPLNRRSHFHLLFDRVLLLKGTVEGSPGSISSTHTSARYSGYLAMTSIFGFGRRCHPASSVFLLAPMLLTGCRRSNQSGISDGAELPVQRNRTLYVYVRNGINYFDRYRP
jgi:hypothetical protein